MIQRIQSLYFLLTAILGIVFLFVPSIEQNDLLFKAIDIWTLMGLVSLVSLIGIITIFLYTNRKLQIQIGRLNLLFIVGLIGLAIYWELQDGDFQPYFGAIIPIFVFILNWLGIRAVNSDEKLVRSADRLR